MWTSSRVRAVPCLHLSRAGVDARGNAVSQTALHVVAAGPLPVVLSGAIHLFKPPCRRGADTATTVSASPGGEMYIPQNFLPRSRQKLLRSAPRTVVSGRGSDAPCGEGSQKR